MKESFDFSYSFSSNEEEILKFWDENESFEKLREKNKDGKKYRFIDGPITANNPMGIHHAWGRTLKDVFLRYKAMQGYQTHYRNGFDGQGLWVEVEVEKELGFKSKKDIEEYGLDKFTDKCIERVKKYSGIITEQSKRLGQWMDWDNSYYTYKDSNITGIWAFLKKCDENGWIKQVYKPMPWCPRCGTSLSEHEMSGSYKEVEHTAVFVKLPLVEKDAKMLVWTTTPWTLTSNVALAVNPELNYVMMATEDGEKLIMGKTYYTGKFASKYEAIEEFKGSELVGLHYETCFPEIGLQQGIDHRIVPWEDVLDDEGCGVVHIAPGCGAEDFELGKREGLEVVIPIDEYGVMNEGCGVFAGKNAHDVRDEVFEELKKRGKLFYTHKITHSYPVCWRCKTEILFRCVKEWAIDVEELRPRLIKNAEKVKWNPPYQGKRMIDWLNNMTDWNISRKRFYGLPLPFYPCECGHVTVIGSKEELREKAIEKELVDSIPHLHRPWIDDIHITCPHCGKPVSRVPQVGDVWLDAGIVPFSTLKYFEDKDYWKEYFPAEYVVEMKEQIRLWFYSMLFMSTVLVDEPPYEQVGTYGMVTAEDGSRFSKTGFMIRFDEAADKVGADPSRYIYAAAPITNDVRYGFNLGTDAKRKLLAYWNLSTFFATYAEIDHPTVDVNSIDVEKLCFVDRWLIALVNEFVKRATEAMETYSTKDVVAYYEKVVDDISNFYIRVNRRRFWKVEDTDDKNTAYTVMMYAIKTITQVMAPIIPFMTEHVWQEVVLRYSTEKAESVHLTEWPKVMDGIEKYADVIEHVDEVRNVISLVLKLRNEKQVRIRQPLSTLYLCKEDGKVEIENTLVPILLGEVNVKELCILDTPDALETKLAGLDFRKAGAFLKGDVNKVKGMLLGLSESDMASVVAEIENGEAVHVPGYETEMPADLFTLTSVSKPNISIVKDNGFIVSLDMNITDELLEEGYLRDILRQCQVFRKEADFNVSDRINVNFTADNKAGSIVASNRQYIENELLANVLDEPIDKAEFTGTIELDIGNITVTMKRA